MIQKILNEATWKRNNNVVRLEIMLSRRIYMGTNVFDQRQYKTVPRPKKFYGSSDEEVIAKATQFLKENGYDQ